MAYETTERRARDLRTGDRVVYRREALRVLGVRTHASGDVEVAYGASSHHRPTVHATYAADDPVLVVAGGFPDRPAFEALRRLVREALREALR